MTVVLGIGCLIGVAYGRGTVEVVQEAYRSGRISTHFGWDDAAEPVPLVAAEGLLDVGCGSCDPVDRQFRLGFEFAARRKATDFTACQAIDLTRRAGCLAYVQQSHLKKAGAVEADLLAAVGM